MSIATTLKKMAQQLPDKVAIEFDEVKVTYNELNLIGNKVSNSFNELGVVKGDRVAQFLPNCLELIYSMIGNLKNGSVIVPMNINFKEDEVYHILNDSQVKAVMTDKKRLPVILNIKDKLQSLKYVILIDGKESQTLNFDELLKNASDKEPNNVIRDEDYAITFYTSGTTGRPKGAALSNLNVLSGIKALVQTWKLSKDDIFVLTLPLYHIHGIGVALLPSLYVGNFIILKRKFKAIEVLECISKRKATLFMGVPTMYFKLLEVDNIENYNLTSMRLYCSGSAPMSKDLFEKLKKILGHEILERAGMSESMMNFSNPYNGDRIPGSVGPCLPGVKVKIVDSNFNEVPKNKEGEILIKGPNVFNGYWNQDEVNKKSFRDGWFITGDVGKVDEKDYVYLIGRSKDIIISGGINIYPREIEEVIESLPQVKECAVVGVPDKEFGESVKAYVILNDNAKIKEDEIIKFCKEKLASFKKPKYIEFLDILPKNTMGKIQKNKLREMHKEK
jgi:acyl-CoA synthetase (AMP-forming)/AMP-acid ligase II